MFGFELRKTVFSGKLKHCEAEGQQSVKKTQKVLTFPYQRGEAYLEFPCSLLSSSK